MTMLGPFLWSVQNLADKISSAYLHLAVVKIVVTPDKIRNFHTLVSPSVVLCHTIFFTVTEEP